MSVCNKLFLVFVILTSIQLVRTDRCPASSPCRCDGVRIMCNSKHLRSVPMLTGTANISYRLNLNGNPNIVITDDSFENITLNYLNLEYNRNMTISDHALKKQRNTLEVLDMSFAELNEIPEALRDLDELRTLRMNHNKIKHWNVTLMQKVGFTLTEIDISSCGLRYWPKWLRHMPNLQRLKVDGNKFGVIPRDAFLGFYLKLKYLNIENTGIREMPFGLHRLEELTELKISGSTLNDSSLYDMWLPSQTCKSSLQTLYIKNTKITRIPLGLSGQKLITELFISGSQIEHVDDKSLPDTLTHLTIMINSLTRINGGICSLSLIYLYLGLNKIERIEKHDLHDCEKLTHLYLNNNNINYISPTAFDPVSHLKILSLIKNKLHHIPIAIQILHSISNVNLSGLSLECTCRDNWFAQWRRNSTRIFNLDGHCKNLGIHLKDFDPNCSDDVTG